MKNKKSITEKVKFNREIIKSTQLINLDEYLKIRNEETVPIKRIEPIRQEDPDIKQGIIEFYKPT